MIGFRCECGAAIDCTYPKCKEGVETNGKDITERLQDYARDYTTTTYHDDLIREAVTEIKSLRQQLQEVCNAIGSPEYMDPPDGGSVTIAGHVSRMREDRDQLRQQLEKIQEHCRDYAAQAETDAGIIKADGKEIHFLRQQFAFATQERNGYREAQDLACEERDELRQQVTLLLELANKCHIELVVQIHELADHIERARGCITDQDMLNQINGQRDYALKVSDNWNQNGNPFESLSATNEN